QPPDRSGDTLKHSPDYAPAYVRRPDPQNLPPAEYNRRALQLLEERHPVPAAPPVRGGQDRLQPEPALHADRALRSGQQRYHHRLRVELLGDRDTTVAPGEEPALPREPALLAEPGQRDQLRLRPPESGDAPRGRRRACGHTAQQDRGD